MPGEDVVTLVLPRDHMHLLLDAFIVGGEGNDEIPDEVYKTICLAIQKALNITQSGGVL